MWERPKLIPEKKPTDKKKYGVEKIDEMLREIDECLRHVTAVPSISTR